MNTLKAIDIIGIMHAISCCVKVKWFTFPFYKRYIIYKFLTTRFRFSLSECSDKASTSISSCVSVLEMVSSLDYHHGSYGWISPSKSTQTVLSEPKFLWTEDSSLEESLISLTLCNFDLVALASLLCSIWYFGSNSTPEAYNKVQSTQWRQKQPRGDTDYCAAGCGWTVGR
jgi:hypothetical protein